MKVKIKKLSPNARVPKYAKPGDACMDLYAVGHTMDEYGNQVYDTQIAMEIPDSEGDRVGQIMILPYPQIEFEEVSELSDSERGSGGFGSTGTN